MRNRKTSPPSRLRHDWILSIDADEALSEALEAEIWQIKKNGPQFDAYTMPRLAQYLGRWILHSGWYPDRKVRLYHRRKAQWVGDYVHETVKVEGQRRAPGIEPAALHLQFAFRASEDAWIATLRWRPSRLLTQRTKVGGRNLVLDPAWTFWQDLTCFSADFWMAWKG